MLKLFAGVVNNRLIVYGTSNIRVVDASIIPLPIAAHIQATVYAIAKRVSPSRVSQATCSNMCLVLI